MALMINETEKTLLDIVEHVEEHGNHLINYDKPRALILGYKCIKTNKEWNIKVSQIREYTIKNSSGQFIHNTVLTNIVTKEGRLELIKILQKASKLKAFW